MSRHSVDLRSAGSKEFLAAHPICWLCGHPGADQIDHDPPVSKAPWLAYDRAHWRPAHGVRGCPLCPPTVSSDKRRHGQPRRCNQAKGDRPAQPSSPRSRRW